MAETATHAQAAAFDCMLSANRRHLMNVVNVQLTPPTSWLDLLFDVAGTRYQQRVAALWQMSSCAIGGQPLQF